MDYLHRPLEELQARAGQFLADDEARVLHVAVDEELAEAARSLLAALEWHPENQCPLFELAHPFTVKQPGWAERTEALRAAYEAQVLAYDQKAIGLPALPAPEPHAPPHLAFAATVAAVARAFTAPEMETAGVLVVLAPGRSGEAARFAQALAELAALPALAKVRWIWLDPLAAGEHPSVELETRLEDAGALAVCRIDRAAEKKENDALVASVAAAVTTGGLPGVARPRMAPPPHPSDPPRDGQPAPVAPAFVAPLLAAVQALRAGRPEVAFDALREARDACLAAGDQAQAVEMELLLGSVGAEVAARSGASREPVLSLLDGALKRAEQAGLDAQAAKAGLVLGCLARLAGKAELAGRALSRAATCAGRARITMLQFHALRLAGEVALDAGLRPRAQTLWTEALGLARAVPSIEAGAMGLTASAEDLTATWQRHSLGPLAREPAEPKAAS